MNQKEILIKIGSSEDLDKELDAVFKDPSSAEKGPDETFYFTPDQFSQIFTKSRVETLKVINDTHPKTMGGLVKLLKRPKESVSRDVNLLSRVGLVEIETHGRERTPRLVSKRFSVSLGV
jgi:predicted transcriptional regulator